MTSTVTVTPCTGKRVKVIKIFDNDQRVSWVESGTTSVFHVWHGPGSQSLKIEEYEIEAKPQES